MRLLKSRKEIRIGLLDAVAHDGVVGHPGVPRHLRIGRQRRLGEARDDGQFRQQMLAGRRASPLRTVNAAQAVLAASPPLALFRAAETGQQIGYRSVDQMAAVELGGDLDRERASSSSRAPSASRSGIARTKLPPEAEERLHLAATGCPCKHRPWSCPSPSAARSRTSPRACRAAPARASR